MIYDVLIVGAGPAGMTAAIYASRGNLKVGLIERNVPGGQIVYTQVVENYPGFKSINGVDLAMVMMEQTAEKDVDFIYEDVTSIKKEDNLFTVTTNENEYKAKAVIIATGQANRKLSVPGENRLIGRGISFCALCDGSLYKDKDVLVVGGGNSAVEESLYLAGVCKSVTIVHQRDEFRADPEVVDKIKDKDNVHIILDSTVQRFMGTDKLEAVEIVNLKTGDVQEMKFSAAFLYAGHLPATSFLKDLGILDERGYIITDQNLMTSIPGLYAAGDCVIKDVRQIATAVSDGSISATHAVKYVRSLK